MGITIKAEVLFGYKTEKTIYSQRNEKTSAALLPWTELALIK